MQMKLSAYRSHQSISRPAAVARKNVTYSPENTVMLPLLWRSKSRMSHNAEQASFQKINQTQFDTVCGQSGGLPVILNIDCSGQEESAAENTHETRHVQCKLKAGIVRHKIFVTKMREEAIGNLQYTNTDGHQPQHQQDIHLLMSCTRVWRPGWVHV